MTGSVWYHAEHNTLGMFLVFGATSTEVLGTFYIDKVSTLASAKDLRSSGWDWIGDL